MPHLSMMQHLDLELVVFGLDNLLCSGSEGRLIDCSNGGIGVIDNCNGHNDDAGLRCLEGNFPLLRRRCLFIAIMYH